MLTDLLTSSRGPGVIGTILALIVLVGFGGLMVFVTSDSTTGKGLGAQIKDKEAAIRSQESRNKHWKTAALEYDIRRKQADKLESLQRKLKRELVTVENAKTGVNEAKQKITQLEEKFDDYKKQYRIAERAAASGEQMETLTTKDGKVYEQVKVLEVTAIGMKIMHKSGNTRVAYQRLPDEMQDRFQFTKEGAQKIARKEQAQVARSVQKAGGYKKAVAIKDLQHKIRVERQNIAKWTNKAKSLQADIRSYQSTVEAAQKRASHYRELYAQGRRGLTMDSAKKAERKAALYRRKTDAARREISSMSRKVTQAQKDITKLTAELQEETAK